MWTTSIKCINCFKLSLQAGQGWQPQSWRIQFFKAEPSFSLLIKDILILFDPGYHEREVFPSHSEVVVMVNDEESKFTGTSGTIAWELEEENVHLIVMWSIPYNLRIYNSYFGIGVVQLRTRLGLQNSRRKKINIPLLFRFTRDMLPYWYKQMIENDQGRNFQRGMPGDSLVYKHEKFFIMGHFDNGYHPTINIRFVKLDCLKCFIYLFSLVLCHGKLRTSLLQSGTSCMLILWGLLQQLSTGNL